MNIPSNKTIIGILTLIGLSIGIGGSLGYWFARQDNSFSNNSQQDTKILYWYDPMRPEQHFDKPGKSPFMDMQLVPKYADSAEVKDVSRTVRIDPQVVQNLGIRTAPVTKESLHPTITANGSVMFSDRLLAILQSRSSGFVQRVYAYAIGDVINKGAPIVDVLMPEWVGAQTEFIAVLKTGDQSLIEATRQRLLTLGIPPYIVSQVASKQRIMNSITLYAPRTGLIQALDVRTGMTLSNGQTLVRINGIDPVWLEVAIPETQASLISLGQRVDINFTAYPGAIQGKIINILPEMNLDSRTLKVRIELPNPNAQLKAGMFGQATIHTGQQHATLLIPDSAIIRTGKRNIVIVSLANGRFQPVEVVLGRNAQGRTEILQGLSAGQLVIVTGQFLIDSEANLQGVLDKLNGKPFQSPAPQPINKATPSHAQNIIHHGIGRIERLTPQEITISHQPINSIGWGTMTMTFALSPNQPMPPIKVGDQISFAFHLKDSRYVIDSIAYGKAALSISTSSAAMENTP